MNPWNYFYAALVIVALYFLFPSQERMTNQDMLTTLKTFGTHNPPPPKTSKDPSEVPIYGPMGEKPDDAPSSSSGVNRLAPPASGEYPEIFGPDSVMVPGTTKKKDSPYDYNPDLEKAFPTSGPPEPYLTDFSKLHH